MEHYLGLALLLSSIISPINTFNTGAPQAACQTLSPDAIQHGAQPQVTDIPYVLDLSSFYDQAIQQYVYTPETTYDIVLESTAAAPTFRGFLIQPRMIADDTTVVGQFEDPPAGGEYRYGSCTPSEGTVTHTSGSDKTTITIPWTAPSSGTGTIHFGFAVVQTRLLYWANQRSVAIAERPCGLPLYLDRQANSCVRQCPLFYFGNHTTALCQPFPAVLDNGIQADATAYFGNIITTSPIGTEVFPFRIVIDLSNFNNDLVGIITILFRDNLVQSIFKFSDGEDQRQFRIGDNGGIDAVNATGVFPEIRLIENRLVVYEDSVIYNQAPPSTLVLPTTLDFDLSIIVFGNGPAEQANFALGTVELLPPSDPCFIDPCRNGGACVALSNETFNCSCHPAYSGTLCETLFDACALEPCQNHGNCTNINSTDYECNCGIEFSGRDCETAIDHCALLTPSCNNGSCVDGIGTFTCQCNPGFTGDFCDINIDECLTAGCQNGQCEDLVNDFRCLCYPGWTGELCNVDIDYCSLIQPVLTPCDYVGAISCIDGNTTYYCLCAPGFTGCRCSVDINECEPNPCQNGGNCTNFLFGVFECTCPEGYSGETCSINTAPCDWQPCANEGACNDLGQGAYSCDCAQGFTGENCSNDIHFCQSDLCLNGGTCVEVGSSLPSCNCTNGFDGDLCEIDLPYCRSDSCLNGGTCVEGLGIATRCNCTEGFDGDRCEMDLPYCQTDLCLNGGICVEDVGIMTSCNCTIGYGGDQCEIDLPYCRSDSCLNGGTCVEGLGTVTSCNCPEGFNGSQCERDLDYCQSDLCLNGGTCIEDMGALTSCNCSEGFDGNRCDIDINYCRADSCLNGGTCIEGLGTITRCNCSKGFDGSQCEIDLSFCQENSCLNGGVCIEGLGIITDCNCTQGFDGEHCEFDDPRYSACAADSCENEGTCLEDFGPNFICCCQDGFSGTLCETDLNFCRPGLCLNGGTCVESIGSTTSCSCVAGFTGQDCGCGTALEDAPLNVVTLDPIIWVIIGFAAGVALTAMLCSLLMVCCYCTCFSARKEKRTKYVIQKGTESMMVQNPASAGTWVGISEVKHGSSSKVDPVNLTSTTTFI